MAPLFRFFDDSYAATDIGSTVLAEVPSFPAIARHTFLRKAQKVPRCALLYLWENASAFWIVKTEETEGIGHFIALRYVDPISSPAAANDSHALADTLRSR